jgi:nucleoside-diphosphate-sugar epimerase
MVAATAGDDELELDGDGTLSRSFRYVGDGVDATMRALDAPPGIYNLGGGEVATMREALAHLEETAGRTVCFRTGPAQTGAMMHTHADTIRLESATGWRATIPLRKGLVAQLDRAPQRQSNACAAPKGIS